ncbi:MAG TPA: YwqG family protein [Ktedonobacteraceae bacterium]|nr:YwqG family protein [Ktedonobacteraceae bacterium]
MDIAGVRTAFGAAGLSRLLKDIDYVAKDAIRLYTKPAGEYDLSIGASRIGGVPDVPPDFKWPERNGVPQAFIAQLAMEEVHAHDLHGELPARGMLWFFYDAKQETYGADPADRGGWQVIFREDYAGLQRMTAPADLPAESQFKAASVSFANEVTLSQNPQLDVPGFDWSDDEVQKYETLLSTFPTPEEHGDVQHQLLGNPQTIQDDMRLECQLASQGVTDINDPRAQELSKGANGWQLLLQIDSDDELGMEWGNTGMIYYWLKASDLKKLDFEEAWLVLQSE